MIALASSRTLDVAAPVVEGLPTIPSESRIGYGIAIDLSIRGSGLLLIDFPIATRPLTTTLLALIG
jgi:hypothetical protein